MAMATAVASLSTLSGRRFFDRPFHFYPFSSLTPQVDKNSDAKSEAKPKGEESRGLGFNPKSLERGAKALCEINSSPFTKQVSFWILLLNFFAILFSSCTKTRKGKRIVEILTN
jgi:ATPase family AAA domain-containing protein 3A/B